MSLLVAVIREEGAQPEHFTGRQVFVSPFNFGDKVKIDGEVTGVLIGMCFYPHGEQFQVTWWNNGAVLEQWFASWRITAMEQQR